jgi:hypothetical protein
MSNSQILPWGNTQIRFLPSRLAEKDVKKAASLVSPSFENLPKDSFVFLGLDGAQVIAAVPMKPQARLFPVLTQGRGVQEAMRQALEKAANFLKGRD